MSGIVAIGSAILLAVAPVTSSGAVGTSPGRDVELRVVSYNIHTGIGSDGRLDLARTAQTLEAVDADVIGLQEVDVHWAARIDYVTQSPSIRTRDVAVVQTQASDHLPVVADLVVRRGN